MKYLGKLALRRNPCYGGAANGLRALMNGVLLIAVAAPINGI